MWTLFETEAQGQLGNGLLKGQVLNSNGIDQQIKQGKHTRVSSERRVPLLDKSGMGKIKHLQT